LQVRQRLSLFPFFLEVEQLGIGLLGHTLPVQFLLEQGFVPRGLEHLHLGNRPFCARASAFQPAAGETAALRSCSLCPII
jgi:hypothetical protein